VLATYLGGVLRVKAMRGCIKGRGSHKLIKKIQRFEKLFSISQRERILQEEKEAR
jgi:hypothetical protein